MIIITYLLNFLIPTSYKNHLKWERENEKHNLIYITSLSFISHLHRSNEFKEDAGTWKGNDDGRVCNSQPTRVCDDRNGVPTYGGYVAKYVIPSEFFSTSSLTLAHPFSIMILC